MFRYFYIWFLFILSFRICSVVPIGAYCLFWSLFIEIQGSPPSCDSHFSLHMSRCRCLVLPVLPPAGVEVMSVCGRKALTLLSSVFAVCSLGLLGIAVSTDYWLYLEEGIIMPLNQSTEIRMSLHSGLWRVCFLAGVKVFYLTFSLSLTIAWKHFLSWLMELMQWIIGLLSQTLRQIFILGWIFVLGKILSTKQSGPKCSPGVLTII